MRTIIATLSCSLGSLAVVSGALVFGSQTAEAGGYYYRARSLYIAPPSYAYLPVIGQPPIVVYEPVVTYPAPVAGNYGPIAAPLARPAPAVAPAVGFTGGYAAGYASPAPMAGYGAAAYAAPGGAARVHERQVSTGFHTRYRYHVENPYGPDYTYRVRQNAGTVRFTERWSH